jgi:hAT family C-terminal dimerisation region
MVECKWFSLTQASFGSYQFLAQNHTKVYPTLARIALDILPVQASSVPCERLFSAGKLVASDRRSRLGAERFEELQMLKFNWRQSLVDLAAWNSDQVEEYDLAQYIEILEDDAAEVEWDVEEDEIQAAQ